MATTTPIPVILCGKTERIGEGVIRELQPEYEGTLPFPPPPPFFFKKKVRILANMNIINQSSNSS